MHSCMPRWHAGCSTPSTRNGQWWRRWCRYAIGYRCTLKLCWQSFLQHHSVYTPSQVALPGLLAVVRCTPPQSETGPLRGRLARTIRSLVALLGPHLCSEVAEPLFIASATVCAANAADAKQFVFET